MKKMESRRPYQSVKEAVELYGKRLLAPELYANVLQQMEDGEENNEDEKYVSKIKSLTIELEEAKQNLEKAKERSIEMENSLYSLQQELQITKRKLKMLKELQEFDEIADHEQVEFLDGHWQFDSKLQVSEDENRIEFHGRKHAIMPSDENSTPVSWKTPSLTTTTTTKKKKKVNEKTKKLPFVSISLIGGIFSKKK